MIKKFNLALMPSVISQDVIQVAQKLSSISDTYLTGSNSLPHLTLYQFRIEENEIDAIWQRACDVWGDESIELNLQEWSWVTFDNNTYWISLVPTKNHHERLHEMHAKIAGVLELEIKKSFDPHITLCNTKNKAYKEFVEKQSRLFVPMKDVFHLRLGMSGEDGQFIHAIR